MPALITTITPEQSARFGEWAREWIAIGLSTAPADFDKATEAALRAYKLCNLDRPKVVLRMSSPYGATVGGALAWVLLKELGSQVESQVESQVGSQVRSQVRSQVESQVGSQVRSQVWSQVRSQVWSQVGSQVWSQVRSQVWSGLANDRGGAFWASWGAYVSFIRDVLGWSDPILDRFEIDEALIKSCGWIWWHEDVLAISDRPCALHRDEAGRLHNASGPSVAYRDGWSLWHWHGLAVPQWIIETPEQITADKIKNGQNQELRRVMLERVGHESAIKLIGAKRIHSDNTGILYREPGRKRDRYAVVEVVNGSKEPDGSHRRYFLSVPPSCKTAKDAVSWTYGLTPKQYDSLKVRT